MNYNKLDKVITILDECKSCRYNTYDQLHNVIEVMSYSSVMKTTLKLLNVGYLERDNLRVLRVTPKGERALTDMKRLKKDGLFDN